MKTKKSLTAWYINDLRREKKLSQQDLADLFGTSAQFISLVENDHSKLPLPMARKLSKKYKGSTQSIVEMLVADYEMEVKAALK